MYVALFTTLGNFNGHFRNMSTSDVVTVELQQIISLQQTQ